MNRTHAAVIAGVLALAALAGMLAATRTTTLGASAQQSSAAALARRTQQLDRFEAALRRQLAAKTPKLPAVPHVPAATPISAGAAAPAPQQVIYRRPAPVVVVKHRAGGEHEGGEHEGSGDGGGGGDD